MGFKRISDAPPAIYRRAKLKGKEWMAKPERLAAAAKDFAAR
ncbi:MAG: hypothetical protein A49_25440 [Methyloceanibacter sp.]|nr:MAG: hypothetical protein A49_25440 [Methyloceanibacter sp.]